ncbi:hypothetical protein NS206_05595 [Microbacterium testaceum]|nr:hypothetical protein NS206_05595 [Microbacterium testaceum]KTS91005.1 hypothetical protein NS183_06235 [Microbacterium testaceum]
MPRRRASRCSPSRRAGASIRGGGCRWSRPRRGCGAHGRAVVIRAVFRREGEAGGRPERGGEPRTRQS